MRRFLDARALEPDPSGSCVAALDKATEVARGAGLEGMAVDYPLQDWVRTTRGRVQDRVVWKGLEVFIVTDATAANMAASGELVSWAAGLMASKADDVGAKPVVVPGGMVVRKYRSGTADTIHFGAGDGHQIWERDHVTGELLAKTQGGPLLGGSPTIEQFDAIPGEWTLVGTALAAWNHSPTIEVARAALGDDAHRRAHELRRQGVELKKFPPFDEPLTPAPDSE